MGNRGNTGLEQNRPLVVSAKEDPASLCAHCDREKITNSPTTSLHLLNRCCSMPNGSLHQLNCVCVCVCDHDVSALMFACPTLSRCTCRCRRLWAAMYYEYVCCIDEDIWRFHMGVSRSILQLPVDVFFGFSRWCLCPPVGLVGADKSWPEVQCV